MFRYSLFLVLIIILTPNYSNGSKERIHSCDTIELTTELPKPWKEIKLTLQYEGLINNRKIKKMTLLIRGILLSFQMKHMSILNQLKCKHYEYKVR
jgi:hypothetical protein